MNDRIETVPRGWYPDPAHPHLERYWDGVRWTQVVRHAEVIELKHPMASTQKPADPAADLPLAGWGRRFCSGLIDSVIAWGLTVAVLVIGYPGFFSQLWTQFNKLQTAMLTPGTQWTTLAVAFEDSTSILLTAAGCVTVAYCVLFLGTWGATLGHKLCGVKVIKAPLPQSVMQAQPGLVFTVAKPGWLRSISKGLGWALCSTGGIFFLLIQVVNVLMPLWHKRKQSLTDVFAGTLLIRVTDTQEDNQPVSA